MSEVSNETLLDLDSVNDMSFEDIPEAPGFVQPPDGLYNLTITKAAIEEYKTKEGEERKRFAHYYSVKNTLELADPTEQAPNEGDKFSERFMMNEQGLKFWKTKAKAILGDIGSITVANALAELSTGNYSFKARIQNKKSKGKDGKEYTNTQVRILGPVEEVPAVEEG